MKILVLATGTIAILAGVVGSVPPGPLESPPHDNDITARHATRDAVPGVNLEEAAMRFFDGEMRQYTEKHDLPLLIRRASGAAEEPTLLRLSGLARTAGKLTVLAGLQIFSPIAPRRLSAEEARSTRNTVFANH